MIEKFNGIIYLIVFLIHFIGFAYYGFRCVVQTKSFLNQYGMDDTGAGVVRFFGSIFIGSTVMAIYIGFIRPNGLEATWAFFNLIFLQNLSAFIVGFYSTKINKLGHTDKTSDEAIYAPLFLTILSAVLCYGLAAVSYTHLTLPTKRIV